jgi:hypothetical protein
MQMPLSIDLDTHGAVSIGGKQTIWLWAADFATYGVQQYIAGGYLTPWDDGEEQPEMPARIQAQPIENVNIDASPTFIGGAEIGTLGKVVTEEGKDELPPVRFAPPGMVPSGEKEADSGPQKKKRG